MNNNTSKAVILVRVSSKAQEDEGYSLDSQLKLLQDYCKNNGLKVVKIYKIAETASKEQGRKIFKELLNYISDNDVQHLAVEKTDRLTRNLKDAVAIDDWLQADGNRMLHAVKENIRLHKESKSDVKFMWNIHLAVAKKYTDNLREEAMKGWAEKLAQGHIPMRPPTGYMTAIRSGKRVHVPDPHISKIIQRAFELYLEPGQTVATIQAFLAQAGVTTYTGRPLVLNAVHRLLKSRYYIGVIDFDGKTYAGAHQPIISKNLFEAAQTKLHGKRPLKRRRLNAMLQNILECGYCGKVITWEKQKGHLYGACQRDTQSCKVNKYLREESAHEAILDTLGELISPSKAIVEWLINQLENDYVTDADVAEEYRKNLQAKIDRLTRMDDALYDDKLAGIITQERFETKRKDIADQLQTAKDDLLLADTTSEQRHNEAIDLIKLTQTAKEQYLDDNMSNEAKRSILTELFDSVILKDNSISVKYSFFAQSVADKCIKTKQILQEANMLNRTNKKDPNYRGQSSQKDELLPLYPVWQGHVESNHDLRFWRPLY